MLRPLIGRRYSFLLGGSPQGFPAFGLLKRDIRGIGWLIRTTGNSLSARSDNLLHVARHNPGRASSARSDNPLHVVNIVNARIEECAGTLEFPVSATVREGRTPQT